MQVRLKADDSDQQPQLQTRKEEADTDEDPMLTVPSKRSPEGESSAERAKRPRTAAQLAYTSYVRKLL